MILAICPKATDSQVGWVSSQETAEPGREGGDGMRRKDPLPRASHPEAVPGLCSGFGAGTAQGPVGPEPSGRAGGPHLCRE